MSEGSSSGSRKRSFVEDDDSSKQADEKKVRFPKGKKVKMGDHVRNSSGGDAMSKGKDPRLVAKERAMRRNRVTAELLDEDSGLVPDIRRAEVQYQEGENFVNEDVTIEPFNLDKEREEGYFDDNGNYVEYINRNEIKDAWLDSVDVAQRYAEKKSALPSDDEKPRDLATEELAGINRRIADALEPGETVLRALRRLKGSSDKKQKMSADTKQIFDQLTEDAMKLMENGDYNVYEEKQESFKREAEGFEKIINARKQGVSSSLAPDKSDDDFDMFADDDDAAGNATTTGTESADVQPSNGGDMQSDYVFDDSSGYYYSSSLGYYYDPSTGLYCSATTGIWYSYNQESQTYEELQQDSATNATNVAEE